jgi:hypothetical protein
VVRVNEESALPHNFADPAGAVCLRTHPTGGDDDEAATCIETDLTRGRIVASERM